MKKILIAIFLLVISVCLVSAEDNVAKGAAEEKETEDAGPEELYAFPRIEPELKIGGGYRFVNVSGSKRAEEFEYLHNSLMFGTEIRLFSFPNRFHLDFEEVNRKDYFGEISYAYKDIFLFRGINRTLFHNLENITLIDLDPSNSNYRVDPRDGDEDYGVKVGINNVFLRLKTPDYPFHFYIDGFLLEKNGSIQQRSLLGSGSFNDIVRTTQSRDIDWETRNIVLGANTHLGPVELDLSHGEKRFDSGGDSVLFDSYTATSSRAAGVYAHNQISDLKGSTNTLKLHTSYTGSLVGSATLSRTDRENTDSNAKADYFIGTGELTWMPLTRLTFFFKYRHKDADFDNPDSVTVTDISNILNTYTYSVRDSISSEKDTISGLVRYRLMTGVTLRGEYSYDDIRRDNAELWELPDTTQRNTASINADIRIVRGLNLKLKYTHKDLNNPAYNIEPDSSNEGRISVSWVPVARVNTLLSYSIAKEKRDEIHYVESNGSTTEAEDRRVRRERILGSVSLMLLKNLSCTGSAAYIRNKAKQDIEYHDTSGIPHIDTDVPYGDIGRNYSLYLNYMPVPKMTVNGGVSHTRSSGSFSPDELNLTEPVSVSSFTKLKIRDTTYSVSGDYEFRGGYTAGIQYSYSTFKDVLDNQYDDVEDGRASIILLTFSKKW